MFHWVVRLARGACAGGLVAMLAFFALLPVALTWEAAAPDSDYSYRFVQPGPEEALAGVFVLVSFAAALTPLPASRWTWAAARSLAWGGAVAVLLLQIVPERASTSSDPWIGLFDWSVTWGLGLAAAVGALLWSAPAEAWLAQRAERAQRALTLEPAK